MARPNNGGWDFVKVGETYQYKEDHFIAMVKVVSDESNENYYKFKVEVQKANEKWAPSEFEVMHMKESGMYSGMSQFFEQPEYVCSYRWFRTDKDNPVTQYIIIKQHRGGLGTERVLDMSAGGITVTKGETENGTPKIKVFDSMREAQEYGQKKYLHPFCVVPITNQKNPTEEVMQVRK